MGGGDRARRPEHVDDDLAQSTRRVLLLSKPGDPATLELDEPVVNTLERDGWRLAWTVAPKVVTYASLARQPTTTTELDALEGAQEADR